MKRSINALRIIAIFAPLVGMAGFLIAAERHIDSINSKRSIMERGNIDENGVLHRDVVDDLIKFDKSLLNSSSDYAITQKGEIINFDSDIAKELGLIKAKTEHNSASEEEIICKKCQAYGVYKIYGDKDRRRLDNLYTANKDYEKSVSFDDLSRRAKLANNIYYIKEYLRVLDAKVENYDVIMSKMGCELKCSKTK